jgi:hypothetical protein
MAQDGILGCARSSKDERAKGYCQQAVDLSVGKRPRLANHKVAKMAGFTAEEWE